MNIERLSESGKGRKYESPTRRAQAEETRRQIANAARELFIERGWSGTRVRDVASAAGVSEPTVYAVYGSKAGLASALLDSLEGVADPRRLGQEVKQAAGDPRAQLAALVAFDRRLFEHGADAITVIREAGRTVPDLASVISEGRARGERVRRHVFGSWPATVWRDGVDVDAAVDQSLALCNVDVYLALTRERHWSPDQVEAWWGSALARLLFAADEM
jgi:AcrR family transcriptional regulator